MNERQKLRAEFACIIAANSIARSNASDTRVVEGIVIDSVKAADAIIKHIEETAKPENKELPASKKKNG